MLQRFVIILCLFGSLVFPRPALSQVACETQNPACILEAAWGAALILPQDKQTRLHDLFIETAAMTGDAALLAYWSNRFDRAPKPEPERTSANYGWQTAEPILQQSGVAGLIAKAKGREAPLHFGRGDVLLAAGKHLVQTQPDSAARLNQALLSLLLSASDFEQPMLADAAAELAVHRCHSADFEEAMQFVDTPQNFRYTFWRARLSGNLGELPRQIRAQAIEEDTRHVRQVLEGYQLILGQGFCPTAILQMAD